MSSNKSWNVLCWNICGINSVEKQLPISNAIELSGCSIVCLQETKRESFDLNFVKLCCPKKFDRFSFIPSIGNSGGLCVIWMSSVFLGSVKFVNPFALAMDFSSVQSGDTWSLLNVYGPCSGPLRADFVDWLF